MTLESKPDRPELYDPVVTDALVCGQSIHAGGASRADVAAAVQILQSRGVPNREIMDRLSLPERQLLRLKKVHVMPYPDMVDNYDTSERRVKHLGEIADTAMGLACDMRTEAYKVGAAMRSMDRQTLIELAMTLACMVDTERTTKDVLRWTTDDGLAQVIPIRAEA